MIRHLNVGRIEETAGARRDAASKIGRVKCSQYTRVTFCVTCRELFIDGTEIRRKIMFVPDHTDIIILGRILPDQVLNPFGFFKI